MAELYGPYRELLINLLTSNNSIDDSGYVVIYGSGKMYFEHRVVMELFLNRMLQKEEVVHHIDGNKSNNKISNLKVMNSKEHTSIHHTGKPKNLGIIRNHRLNDDTVKRIKELSKTLTKKNGKPNYCKIAKELGISDFTVARHLK